MKIEIKEHSGYQGGVLYSAVVDGNDTDKFFLSEAEAFIYASLLQSVSSDYALCLIDNIYTVINYAKYNQ